MKDVERFFCSRVSGDLVEVEGKMNATKCR